MVSLSECVTLNPRQERFVTLVASGLSAGRAYEQAGYASRGNAADVGASKLVRNPKVAYALQRERDAGREASRLTRDEKLGILEEIARNGGAPARERIAAIKVHNDMTGEGAESPASRPGAFDVVARARELASTMKGMGLVRMATPVEGARSKPDEKPDQEGPAARG